MPAKHKNLLATLIILLSSVVSISAHALSQHKEHEITQNIKAPGSVCINGEACANKVVVSSANKGPRTGEEIYNTNCTACHSTGAAGAPIKGSSEQWKARLAKGKKTLYENALNGFGVMPAKGLCMDCSEEEIKATVDYITQ